MKRSVTSAKLVFESTSRHSPAAPPGEADLTLTDKYLLSSLMPASANANVIVQLFCEARYEFFPFRLVVGRDSEGFHP
jgi:hypothetical protein